MATATSKTSTRKPAAKKKAPVKKAAVKFVAPETEEGTWQDTIVKSAVLKDRAEKGSTKAGEMLWSGAQQGVVDWLPESDEDASAEGLYQTLLLLMGKARKGDASKIAKVAVAVKDAGLQMSQFTSLSKAYGAARALLDAAPEQEREDAAAEALVEEILGSAPKSTSTPEGAAAILLGAGADEFARIVVAKVIETAGSYEKAEPVLRSIARALSQEIVGTKPKPEPKAKAPAKPKGETVAKATAKPASAKGKAAPAKPKAKPAPVEVEDEVDDEPLDDDIEADLDDAPEVDETDDLLDEVEAEDDEVEDDEVEEAPKAKAKPVVRRR